MNVFDVQNDIEIQANSIYIMPPHRELSINRKIVSINKKVDFAQQMPFDYFFRSFADFMQDDSIGLLLSEFKNDGVLGLQQIKSVGGMVMVQRYDSFQSDLADYILSPDEMPRSLLIM